MAKFAVGQRVLIDHERAGTVRRELLDGYDIELEDGKERIVEERLTLLKASAVGSSIPPMMVLYDRDGAKITLRGGQAYRGDTPIGAAVRVEMIEGFEIQLSAEPAATKEPEPAVEGPVPKRSFWKRLTRQEPT